MYLSDYELQLVIDGNIHQITEENLRTMCRELLDARAYFQKLKEILHYTDDVYPQ